MVIGATNRAIMKPTLSRTLEDPFSSGTFGSTGIGVPFDTVPVTSAYLFSITFVATTFARFVTFDILKNIEFEKLEKVSFMRIFFLQNSSVK